jgi:hypothetical protein
VPSSGIQLSGALAALARVNIRYLIEWHKDGALYRAVSLPLPPNALSVSAQAPSQVTYTLGQPIRELGRYRQRTIELSGSAGYDARPGFTATGAITSQLGPAILISFTRFLEEYQRTAALEGAESHELIFRALDEEINLKVEVSALGIERNADGANLAPEWSLSLQSYDDAAPAPEDALFDLEGFLEDATAAIQITADEVASLQLITEGANAYVRRGISGPLIALDKLTSAVTGTVNGLRELADIPADILRQISKTAGSLRTSVSALIDDLVTYDDEINAEWSLLLKILGATEEIEIQAESVSAITPLPELETATAPPLVPSASEPIIAPLRDLIPTTAYRLRLGEDLRTIAARVFSDAERWPELSRLNGWLSSDRDGRGQPPRAGSVILIPDPIQSGAPTQREPYGVDLFIDPTTGDLDLVADDLATVRGSRNLEQALTHRLHTRQGETPILSRYGLPLTIGERVTTTSAGYLSAHIREQLARDLRVDRVNVIEVSDKGDHLSAALEFTARAGGLMTSQVRL